MKGNPLTAVSAILDRYSEANSTIDYAYDDILFTIF